MKNPCVIPIMMHISKLKIKGGNMLIERNIKDFLDDLASKSPTPGGGSAAALCGAVAASLVSMVCNLTMGKKKYADFEAIYDLKGKVVECLSDGKLPTGNHVFTWDGSAVLDEESTSGVFFVKAIIDEEVITKKIQLVK